MGKPCVSQPVLSCDQLKTESGVNIYPDGFWIDAATTKSYRTCTTTNNYYCGTCGCSSMDCKEKSGFCTGKGDDDKLMPEFCDCKTCNDAKDRVDGCGKTADPISNGCIPKFLKDGVTDYCANCSPHGIPGPQKRFDWLEKTALG